MAGWEPFLIKDDPALRLLGYKLFGRLPPASHERRDDRHEKEGSGEDEDEVYRADEACDQGRCTRTACPQEDPDEVLDGRHSRHREERNGKAESRAEVDEGNADA